MSRRVSLGVQGPLGEHATKPHIFAGTSLPVLAAAAAAACLAASCLAGGALYMYLHHHINHHAAHSERMNNQKR
eukprot:COSAG05_NODE_20330_length_280_cov_0.850829_1_plen_73_part_01